MKLPVHVLRRIDYYEVEPFVEKKRDYFNRYFRITVYWKRVTRRFLWFTIDETPHPKAFEFRCITKKKGDTSYYVETNECKELREQLHQWFEQGREEKEIEGMIDDLLNKDEH